MCRAGTEHRARAGAGDGEELRVTMVSISRRTGDTQIPIAAAATAHLCTRQRSRKYTNMCCNRRADKTRASPVASAEGIAGTGSRCLRLSGRLLQSVHLHFSIDAHKSYSQGI